MVSASSVALKKKATVQWNVPTGRRCEPLKLNGVAAIVLRPAEVQALFDACTAGPLRLPVDVLRGTIGDYRFELTAREKLLLSEDVDWIGATLRESERIAAFEAAHLGRHPWLCNILER